MWSVKKKKQNNKNITKKQTKDDEKDANFCQRKCRVRIITYRLTD